MLKKSSAKILIFVLLGIVILAFLGIQFMRTSANFSYSVSQVNLFQENGKDGKVKIEDRNVDTSFNLPSGWEKDALPPKSPWHLLLVSQDGQMALRFGYRKGEKKELLYSMGNYVRRKLGIKSKDKIKLLVKNIKIMPRREYSAHGAEYGAVTHFNLRRNTDEKPNNSNENKSANDEKFSDRTKKNKKASNWRKEHLIAFYRDNRLYYFSFLAKKDFFPHNRDGASGDEPPIDTKMSRDEFVKKFLVPENPIVAFSRSFKFH